MSNHAHTGVNTPPDAANGLRIHANIVRIF